MPKAIWNGKVLVESKKTVVVDEGHYFPPDSINSRTFNSSGNPTSCPWKGQASYCDIGVNGKIYRGEMWYYPNPKSAAKDIKGYIPFWKGGKVEAERKEARSNLLGWLWN